MRVLLIANQNKPEVNEALASFRPWLKERAEIVADINSYQDDPIDIDADLMLVFGGDGTMLGIARSVIDLGIPMVGVNFGKLGFLAPFTLDDVMAMWDDLAAGRLPLRQRVMLEATLTVDGQDEPYMRRVAMNDCVVTAGPPFRIIDMEMIINPDRAHPTETYFAGDGVIISTSTGSTAYNLSAGGPIVSPDVESFVVTPICPHTLSFRPTVLSSEDLVQLRVTRANEGTTVVLDGQLPTKLQPGSTLTVRAYPQRLTVVSNPRMSYWQTLASKMHWARRPQFGNDH